MSNVGLRIMDYELRITDYELRITDYQLPITNKRSDIIFMSPAFEYLLNIVASHSSTATILLNNPSTSSG